MIETVVPAQAGTPANASPPGVPAFAGTTVMA